MKDYYKILELESDASLQQIKSAYRQLAKRYHPDSHHQLSSEDKFIEVNEAYEFLSDDSRRSNYKYKSRKITPEQILKREEIYQRWVKNQQEKTRARAYRNSGKTFDEFKETPIFKTAMLLNKVYNYIFVAVGILMAIMPIVGLLTHELEEGEEAPGMWDFILPVFLGATFTYGVYYFLFKIESDE